jgi:unsaturated rhamnogalacturonyl hydrolase
MTRLMISVFLLTTSGFVCAEQPVRPPKQVAEELLQVYGKKLDAVTYIPALAMHGRWRFGDLADDASHRTIVENAIVPARPVPKSQVEFAGRLVFAPIARSQQGPHKDRALVAVLEAADQLFTPVDPQRVKSPSPHEMSDAVFMCGPILCEAGALSGETRYFDAAVQYLGEMRKLRQREDGLYRHGHLCDAAWGRGNGFPAVGVAWCLTLLPKEHSGHHDLLAAYQHHMSALVKHQTTNGLWRQVVDVPEAYEEFSATAMIGFAMQRGVTSGWLDQKTYQPVIDKAWQAVCAHIEPGGKIINVCEGTGTQKSLEDYLKRKAIRGIDDRGGAMGLLFSIERMAAQH